MYREYKDSPVIPTEDEQADMYLYAVQALAAGNFSQYEVSNFAKRGFESRHNMKYWNLEDYLGLGAAAHSFIADKRFSNPEDVSKYVDSWQTGNPAVVWHQENTWEDSLTDYIFTALRKTEGIGKRDFAERFGREFWDVFADRRTEFEEYMAAGDAAEDKEAVRITRKGMDIASELIALFL